MHIKFNRIKWITPEINIKQRIKINLMFLSFKSQRNYNSVQQGNHSLHIKEWT